MRPDKTAHYPDLASIPREFRENYRFLCELITCKEKNDSAWKGLEALAKKKARELKGRLTRRQIKILNDFRRYTDIDGPYGFSVPVPPELEASIRIRKRATWLPWEAEAIQKIERWRGDVTLMSRNLTLSFTSSPDRACVRGAAESGG
ncbi:MAG: hypothetical protein P8182_01950 [Deltaproteobacteria bacterium]